MGGRQMGKGKKAPKASPVGERQPIGKIARRLGFRYAGRGRYARRRP